jgi:hypothetical protein
MRSPTPPAGPPRAVPGAVGAAAVPSAGAGGGRQLLPDAEQRRRRRDQQERGADQAHGRDGPGHEAGLAHVAGVWAAGNVADPRMQVITAAGSGSAAATP